MSSSAVSDITILCKVVDNYGDIGFVYRLARALSLLDSSLKLRLVVSNLHSFARMAPGIDETLSVQTYNGWRVYDWNDSAACTAAFTAEPPHVILECFQCGRPDWLETLLFTTGVPDIVQILNVEYLTAEPWADDFHCLLSATRSARVHKVNFMPGFTSKTGGLVLDRPFVTYSAPCAAGLTAGDIPFPAAGSYAAAGALTQPDIACSTGTRSAQSAAVHTLGCTASQPAAAHSVTPALVQQARAAALDTIAPYLFTKSNPLPAYSDGRGCLSSLPSGAGQAAGSDSLPSAALSPADFTGTDSFTVLIFSYERDYTSVTAALARFQTEQRRTNAAFTVHALAASGKSLAPFLDAWRAAGKPFAVTQLPYLPQTVWDALLCLTQFNFIRGEDSLSRACLAGIPFVWHAYPQDQDYQLVKVQALLDRITPYLSAEDAASLTQYWLQYNKTAASSGKEPLPQEVAAVLPHAAADDTQLLLSLLRRSAPLRTAFTAFSAAAAANGDLAAHLLTYLHTLPL